MINFGELLSFKWVKSFWEITKPSISFLVAFTTLPSLIMAGKGLPSAELTMLTLVGTYLASASASSFNHIIDADIDSEMLRTRKRPLASGKVSRLPALGFGTMLGSLSFGMLWFLVDPLCAWIALAANFFYVVVYTLVLKRRTAQNIVIGGAAGAVGPLIGWSAVTHGAPSWQAWALFMVIFLWTPPHFWALAIKYRDDYRAAKIPMLPSVRGVKVTKKQIFFYTLTLFPAVLSVGLIGDAGIAYLLVGGFATLYFSYLSFKLLTESGESFAMPVFFYSLVYIFLIFGALSIEQLAFKV